MTSLRNDARRVLDARRERAASTPVRLAPPALSTVAVAVVLVAVLLLAGAGLPFVVVAVAVVALLAPAAAHRTTANVLAGVTLRLVRPYLPGERVRLHLPENDAADTVDAEIVRVGLANTTLVSDDGVLVVPNTRLLSPAPR